MAAAIEKLRGQVTWEQPPRPVWLRGLLGDDFFNCVVESHFNGDEFIDLLEYLEELSQLRKFSLANAHRLTDAGLEHLKGLSQLQICRSTTPTSPMLGWNILRG